MSIINTVVKTKQQIVKETVNLIRFKANVQFDALVANWIEAYDAVWNNKDGLTAQEVLDGFGKDATSLFQSSFATQNYINSIVPNTLTQTALQVPTFNQDGTVTLQ